MWALGETPFAWGILFARSLLGEHDPTPDASRLSISCPSPQILALFRLIPPPTSPAPPSHQRLHPFSMADSPPSSFHSAPFELRVVVWRGFIVCLNHVMPLSQPFLGLICLGEPRRAPFAQGSARTRPWQGHGESLGRTTACKTCKPSLVDYTMGLKYESMLQ